MPQQFPSIVRDLSHKGLGVIDHPDGRVFFVRGVWPGDEGKFEVEEAAPAYSEARLVDLSRPSPERVPVACPHRGSEPGKCGGCPWMMGSYSSQLKFKAKRLKHALEKRGVRVALEPIVPSPQELAYRNRIQFKTTGTAIGFVSEASNVFAPIDDCLVLNPKLHDLFLGLKAKLPAEEFFPSNGHQWNYLDVDDLQTLDEVTVNKRRPFRQGNSAQNEYMRQWVRDNFSKLPNHWPVIDLFCGSGNFTEVLSDLGYSNILAVEVQGTALTVLREKALSGVRILPLDIMAKGSWASIARAQPHAKAILIDPPREGLEKRRGLLKYLDNLERIFYISCELDTFSRDAQDLLKHGWHLEELRPVDMFPHTPHVEILSIFSRATPVNA